MKKLLRLALVFLCLLQLPLAAQTVTGLVIDETKQPVIGASVKIAGTTIGTVTDVNGKFTIKSPSTGKLNLEISFVGYEKQTRAVTLAADQTVDLRITLNPVQSMLDEVVVVGYGVQRRRDVTSSVVKIAGKEITDIPTPSFENGLQGKASGVQVITGSGVAGSGSIIRVRGIASVSAGGDPLYVIDGIPITQDYALNRTAGMNNNPLSSINPNDIESVEILKDAAATGIYGSRGSNGVILITTKRGKKKGFHGNASVRVGIANPTALPNMLNSQEYLQLVEEAWVNDGKVGTPTLPNSVSWADAQNTNTDLVKETIQTGFKSNIDASVAWGGEKTNLYFGISQQNAESYLIGNRFDRTSARFNGDFTLFKKLTVGVSSSLSQGMDHRVGVSWGGGFGNAMSYSLPIYPIYYDKDVLDDDGNVKHHAGDYWLEAGVGNNPVASRELQKWQSRELRTINSLSLNYNPVKDLYIRFNGGYDYMDYREDRVELAGYDVGRGYARAYQRPLYVANYNGSLTANYLKTINEKHAFNFLLGTEYQDSYTTIVGEGYRDSADVMLRKESDKFARDRWFGYDINLLGPSPTGIPLSNSPVKTRENWNFVSYFTRINYNFNRKYFVEVLARVDGSNKFGVNNRYGFFPAASAGWILSEETFLKNSKVVSFMKFKSSYGENGNANIYTYAQYALYGVGNNGYNNQTYITPDASNPGNPNLKWETSRTLDVALEFGLFQDRISGELAYYRKKTTDVLLQVSPQNNVGFTKLWANTSTVFNYGFEAMLKARIIEKKAFRWESELIFARNENYLADFGGYGPDAVGGGTNDTRLEEGKSIINSYLVRFSHIDPATGRPVYLDKDGNETFTWSNDDRVSAGSLLPKALGSWSNRFYYKNFDLTMMWVYTIGGHIYDGSAKRQIGTVTDWNMRTDRFDRWRQPGDEAQYPVMTSDITKYGLNDPWQWNTTMWLYDASYARLRNLTLGYTFGEETARKLRLGSLRVAFIATNILTLTRFPGLDPETARDSEGDRKDLSANRNIGTGNIIYLNAPQEKTFNLSVEISF